MQACIECTWYMRVGVGGVAARLETWGRDIIVFDRSPNSRPKTRDQTSKQRLQASEGVETDDEKVVHDIMPFYSR